MNNHEEILKDTAKIWCPDYPRRVAGFIGADWGQLDAHDPEELVHNLIQVQGDYPGYISTYSFPNGHPTDDLTNIPRINTLMIDFDIDKSKFMRNGEFSRVQWARHMKKLLDRLNAIAEALLERDKGNYWRWSLSGYKGAHAYLDFPEIDFREGRANQFHDGMETYTNVVINTLKDIAEVPDLNEYIDVCSGWDLSRLTRLPNTVHEKATDKFGETKYCIPVTTEEMARIDPSDYVKMTREPRLPDVISREPRQKAAETAARHIRIAPKESSGALGKGKASVKNEELIQDYKENVVNDRVNLADVAFLLKRKPCIWGFRESQNMFSEGNASHVMETQCIVAMASIGTPIDVMHDFFKASPRYDQQFTQNRIEEILSRDYSEFDCSKVLEQAEQFCWKRNNGPDQKGCKIYKGDKELQQLR